MAREDQGIMHDLSQQEMAADPQWTRPPAAGGVRPSPLGIFGPGKPMLPQQPLEKPRIFQYRPGINLAIIPRSGFGIVDFQTLRNLAATCKEVRLNIELIKREVRSLDWEIVPTDDNDKADHVADIKLIENFFRRPDGHIDFDSWQNQVVEEILVTDSLTLYPNFIQGHLDGIDLIDGTTVRPVLDYRGKVARPPAPSYVQVLYGLPASYFMLDEMYYRPLNLSVYSPYGTSPIEFFLMTVNLALRREVYHVGYYTEGNTPESLVGAPASWSQKQIDDWQQYWDTLIAGDVSQQRKMHWVPVEGGRGSIPVYEFHKDNVDTTTQDEWMMRVACWAFGNSPNEFGLTNSGGGGLGGAGYAGAMEDVHYRSIIGPTTQHLQRIYSDIIAFQMKMPHLKFQYVGLEPPEDTMKNAQVDQIYLQSGVYDAGFIQERDGIPPEHRPKSPEPPEGGDLTDGSEQGGGPAPQVPFQKGFQITPRTSRDRVEDDFHSAMLLYFAGLRKRIVQAATGQQPATLQKAGQWVEDEHPRGKGGKFTHKGQGVAPSGKDQESHDEHQAPLPGETKEHYEERRKKERKQERKEPKHTPKPGHELMPSLVNSIAQNTLKPGEKGAYDVEAYPDTKLLEEGKVYESKNWRAVRTGNKTVIEPNVDEPTPPPPPTPGPGRREGESLEQYQRRRRLERRAARRGRTAPDGGGTPPQPKPGKVGPEAKWPPAVDYDEDHSWAPVTKRQQRNLKAEDLVWEERKRGYRRVGYGGTSYSVYRVPNQKAEDGYYQVKVERDTRKSSSRYGWNVSIYNYDQNGNNRFDLQTKVGLKNPNEAKLWALQMLNHLPADGVTDLEPPQPTPRANGLPNSGKEARERLTRVTPELQKRLEAANKAKEQARKNWRAEDSESNLKAYQRAVDEYSNANEAILKDQEGALKVDQPLKLNHQIFDPEGVVSIERRAKVELGVEKFKSLVEDSAVLGKRDVDVVVKSSVRAFFNGMQNSITISKYDETSTICHELGHWLETNASGVQKAANDFLSRRTAGEPLQKLKALTGIDYDDWEEARPDKFHNPYVGKYYSGGSTEVISMGVQRYIEGPQKFAQEDPEYFDLIFESLHGLKAKTKRNWK